jgi:acetyl-CoA carboxylase carboxyl transferase subunit alpha
VKVDLVVHLPLVLEITVLMFENSIYAILSPEGYASIIYKDASKADHAAELMKLTAEDLKRFGIIDTIIIRT